MQVDIRGNHSLMLQIVREHLERKMRFALGRFGSQIVKTRCEVDDANGPRGGVDKVSRLSVLLRNGETVRAEAIDTDFFTSIDRAAARLARSVERTLSRQRDRDRRNVPEVCDESLAL